MGERAPRTPRERGPRCVREKTKSTFKGGVLTMERDVDDGQWTDVWLFDDLVMGTNRLHAAGGLPVEEHKNMPAVYEDFRPGAYDQAARLADMDTNHQEVGISYPNTFPRFAGQGFAERGDKALALASLQIYNDWMIDVWCGGAGRGRLVPLTLIPLWDPVAAAAEVRRCATKGSYAIAFSENPAKLGFSSLYTGDWDVLWDACEETDTTISMHIGSSSSMPTTCPDAPLRRFHVAQRAQRTGLRLRLGLQPHSRAVPPLKLAYAESQVGWMPFQYERMDGVWHEMSNDAGSAPTAFDLCPRPGLRLHLRRPPRPALPGGDRHGAHPLRVRLPAHERIVPELPSPGLGTLPRPGSTRARCTSWSTATRSRSTAWRDSGSTNDRISPSPLSRDLGRRGAPILSAWCGRHGDPTPSADRGQSRSTICTATAPAARIGSVLLRRTRQTKAPSSRTMTVRAAARADVGGTPSLISWA